MRRILVLPLLAVLALALAACGPSKDMPVAQYPAGTFGWPESMAPNVPPSYGGTGDVAGNLLLIQQGLGQATSPYGSFPRPTICSPSGRSVICY